MGELLTGKPQPLSAVELRWWCHYRRKYGFATDRLEWTAAHVGAKTNGGRPIDLTYEHGKQGGEVVLMSAKESVSVLTKMPNICAVSYNLAGKNR